MLNIKKYIIDNGLEKTISDFKLKSKFKNNLISLKYDQLESDMSKAEVQECRGIILDITNFNPVCYPFNKFFNYGESNAAKIDWNTAKCYKKYDGSIMTLYYYNVEWNVSTSRTIDAKTPVYGYDLNFDELFWITFKEITNLDVLNNLDKNCNYMFEMCTPYNIIVTQHKDKNLYLLGARNLNTLKELTSDELEVVSSKINIPFAESYSLYNYNDILATLNNMPYSEEGYVVCDANFNRLKIKNPAYCAVHHLKNNSAKWTFIKIVKSNEIDEFTAVFPECKNKVLDLKAKYDRVILELDNFYHTQNLEKIETKKEYASIVLNTKNPIVKAFFDFFFKKRDGKVENSKQFILEYEEKKLFYKLDNLNI